MSAITSSSGYGYNTKQPFVNLLVGDRKPIQLSPDQARSVARQLTEAAEAAEQDAFLVSFFQKSVGMDERQVAGILMQFRAFRERPNDESQ